MPRKSELIEAMVALGEHPPKSWTVAEIESRLSELRQEHGIAPPHTGKSRTPLRQMMVDLNQASRKKSNLIDHVKSLGVATNGNETIKVLMAKGIQAIYDKAEPTGQDPVGFGTHASKTYEELFQGEASYCQWIRTMVQEEESVNPRFMHLALWLDHRQEGGRHSEASDHDSGSFQGLPDHQGEDGSTQHDRGIQFILERSCGDTGVEDDDHDVGHLHGRDERGTGSIEERATSQASSPGHRIDLIVRDDGTPISQLAPEFSTGARDQGQHGLLTGLETSRGNQCDVSSRLGSPCFGGWKI